MRESRYVFNVRRATIWELQPGSHARAPTTTRDARALIAAALNARMPTGRGPGIHGSPPPPLRPEPCPLRPACACEKLFHKNFVNHSRFGATPGASRRVRATTPLPPTSAPPPLHRGYAHRSCRVAGRKRCILHRGKSYFK